MKVAFLTEGGKNKGFGHLVRCVALAEKLTLDGAEVHMLVDCDSSCKNIFKNISYEIFEWQSCENIHVHLSHYGVVIVDSYTASQEYINTLQALDSKLLFFDDYGRLKYPRGFILNYAPYLDVNIYKQSNLSYLLGGEFAVLRSEFTRKKTSFSKKANKAVVMLGAADTSFVTADILYLLLRNNVKTIKVITSKANKKLNKLKHDFAPFGVEFLVSVSAKRVARAIFVSDFAVSACSQSMLEIASVGLPFVPVKTEQNQSYYCAAKTIDARDRHFKAKINASLVGVLKHKTKKAVYNGATKISSILNVLFGDIKSQSFLFKNFINLTDNEKDELLHVRNHPNIRRYMFSDNEIRKQEHYDFINSLKAKENRVYFAVYQGEILLGAIYLTDIDYLHKCAKLGIYKNQEIDFKNMYMVLESFLDFIGKKLFIKTILLEVLDTNAKAIGFYLKNNFCITKKSANALLMERRLD